MAYQNKKLHYGRNNNHHYHQNHNHHYYYDHHYEDEYDHIHSHTHMAFKRREEEIDAEGYNLAETERALENLRHRDHNINEDVDKEAEDFIKLEHRRINLTKLISMRTKGIWFNASPIYVYVYMGMCICCISMRLSICHSIMHLHTHTSLTTIYTYVLCVWLSFWKHRFVCFMCEFYYESIKSIPSYCKRLEFHFSFIVSWFHITFHFRCWVFLLLDLKALSTSAFWGFGGVIMSHVLFLCFIVIYFDRTIFYFTI